MKAEEGGVPCQRRKVGLLARRRVTFIGADVVEWIQERVGLESRKQAVAIATRLVSAGKITPLSSKSTELDDEKTLFTFCE